MTTSASWDFSLTAAQIIAAAYEDLGAIIAGATVPAAQSTLALSRLNMIVKQYQGTSDGAPGVKVHTRNRITLALAKGQQTYTVGPATTDSRSSTAFGRATLTAGASATATALTVSAVTDTTSYPGTTITMTASDFVGVQQSDGALFWTTISAASGTSLTLNAGLAVAASSGAAVYWFTTRAQRFPVIESAVLRKSSMTDTPLDIYTDPRQYEAGVVDKYADGTPNSMLVEPLRLNTKLTLNSQPTDVTDTIVLTVLYPAEDYDATTNDIAFPQEAYRFLKYELMFELSTSVGRWTPQMEKNRNEAKAMYLNLNPENSVAYFQPNA